ncbi:hypothetical protein ARAM_005041 [Aspergillus rambellii]|uniref:CorA family metal ion transporter n=1 Tax=Aspergillus rambellii TaxID=308745 RepID=A0A0F8WV82_9EURO|nr:hypothetical protein ARAM_005041 [Aspergillus rambellii]
MELDTPMIGLDPEDNVQFKPGPCVVAEMRRYSSRKASEYKRKVVGAQEVDNWIEERGEFASPAASEHCGAVRWIFACTSPTALDSDGNYLSSNETLELALSQETFDRLTTRYGFSPQVQEAWRYRSSSGCGARKIEYDDSSGEIKSLVLVMSIRLSGSFASVIAINHDFRKKCTVVLALRVSPYDQTLLQKALESHQDLVGHPLLIPTMVVEISLATNMLYMQKIRHELSVIEKATGQHAWLQIPAADAPAHDSELSRLGHAVKIHISLSRRRLDSIKCWLELIKKSLKDLEQPISNSFVRTAGPKHEYEQWMGNVELLVQFRQVDLCYSDRRADNQVTAIYGLLSQRDNMVGVSVAIESKKISEASKRDGSALKSLTVLTALFFPATYIATLFTLPNFAGTPFWLYWAVAIPLTLVIFGSWASWTFYRQHQIAQETTARNIDQDIELDPERAFPPSPFNAASSSFVMSTLRQIRLQTKQSHAHSTSADAMTQRIEHSVGNKNMRH